MVHDVNEQFQDAVIDLKAKMEGRITARGDEAYEDARRVWNGAVDHYPVAIAFCESAEDVQAAVRTARAHHMPVSARSRGHDPCGRSVRSDALVIDLSLMNHVQIDHQIATVAGGATSANVIAAANARNLVAVTGWNGPPGMTGSATVGGYGPFIARHGLALDNLMGAELVLADGQRVIVDQENNPDLLWACKGGGGNFGLITSLKLRLQPWRPVLAGLILFSWAEAQTVMSRYTKAIETASNNLTVLIGIMSLRDGSPALFLAPVWTGEMSDGEIATEVLKRCGNPMHVQIAQWAIRT
jgi:FAD/FMN-containing dehydrogenase